MGQMAADKFALPRGGVGLRKRPGQMPELAQRLFGCCKEVQARALGQGEIRLDAVQPRVDQQGEGDVGVHPRVGGAQLGTPQLARCGGDADELGAVLAGPADPARGLPAAETLVGVLGGIQEGGDLIDARYDPGDHLGQQIPPVGGFDGEVDVHAVARLIRQGLGGEIRSQAVSRHDGLHHRAEGQGVVGGGERFGVAEVDLVLARALLVVGALGLHAHLLERDADLPADVLALVHGGDVHVAGAVVGDRGGLALLIGLEEIKLHLRAERKAYAQGCGALHRLFQQRAGVCFQRRPVGVGNAAEHAHDLPVFPAPGERGERSGIGAKKEV